MCVDQAGYPLVFNAAALRDFQTVVSIISLIWLISLQLKLPTDLRRICCESLELPADKKATFHSQGALFTDAFINHINPVSWLPSLWICRLGGQIFILWYCTCVMSIFKEICSRRRAVLQIMRKLYVDLPLWFAVSNSKHVQNRLCTLMSCQAQIPHRYG